jgi:transposase InsO family protein
MKCSARKTAPHPHGQRNDIRTRCCWLAIEDIEHRTTKIRSRRTNGFVEQMNGTLLDECFRAPGGQTWYIGVDDI